MKSYAKRLRKRSLFLHRDSAVQIAGAGAGQNYGAALGDLPDAGSSPEGDHAVEMNQPTEPVVEDDRKTRDPVGTGSAHSFHPGLPVTTGATA